MKVDPNTLLEGFCHNCRFLGEVVTVQDEHSDFQEVETEFHECDRIKHVDKDLVYSSKMPTESAHVVDGSGYFAALRVKGDFGCKAWELKE